MANDYYVPAGVPANNAALSSSAVRGELGSVEDGFEKLPAITGNNSKIVRVNAGATALETVATVPHEQGGVEADISAIADGGILVGTGTGTMGIRASALTGGASGFLKHEIGGVEADISAIADGGLLVGTGTGTMAVRAGALTGGASGFLKHEIGGIEADISAIADGGILVGTGTGTMAVRASALTAGATGYLKHEVGGLEFNASGVVDGDFLVGTGTGTIGIESGQTALSSLGIVTKYKIADTSRSSTATLADDTHLYGWTLAADSVYKITGCLILHPLSGTSIDMCFVTDNEPQFGAWNPAHAGSLDAISISATQYEYRYSSMVFGAITLSGAIHTHATLSSILDFQWAQDVSDAAVIVIYKGSWISVEKLGAA